MATAEHQIEALGGTFPPHRADYGQGFTEALHLAAPIAADADALIDELLGCLVDGLNGKRPLDRWAHDARTLVIRVAARRGDA